MIVSGRYIGDDRTEHVEGSIITEALLHSDILSNFIQLNMSRTFDHYLNSSIKGTLLKFTKGYQLLDLCLVGSIRKAARSQAVSK